MSLVVTEVPAAGSAAAGGVSPAHRLDSWLPKSLVCLREGHCRRFFVQDLLAGLTVGVIALPLAIAFAIASHVPPERGLYTAIVAGFLVSLLGGSRVQVAGPTGAFVIIIAGVVDQYGYPGLWLATAMAGVILIILGVFKLGAMIKFIPYPVTTGFTTGIALIIFTQQIKDLLGLGIEKAPTEFVHQWITYGRAVMAGQATVAAAAVGLGSLVVLALLRKYAPRVPSYIVAVLIATVIVAAFGLDERHGVQTIQSRFQSAAAPSGIPQKLPSLTLDPLKSLDWTHVRELIPSATTIALLAAIESLLCAVVADGMIGGRHKSNLELFAQGVANLGSVALGGIPATGAIARTAANVKAGGRTPVAGIVHAAVVLALMLLAAPYAGRIPLAALAAVLVMVAWNMSEREHFKHIFHAPRSDVAVLLTTFGLTVFADLTVAVGVGMVLAAMLFMRRMSEVTNIGLIRDDLEDQEIIGGEPDPNSVDRRDIPPHTEVYEINGPFFFGVAERLRDTLRGLAKPPRVLVLRMRRVSAIDASGMHALEEFHHKCHRQGTILLLSGVHAQPMFALARYGLLDKIGEENLFGNLDDALNRAREILGLESQPKPAGAVPEVARERMSASGPQR